MVQLDLKIMLSLSNCSFTLSTNEEEMYFLSTEESAISISRFLVHQRIYILVFLVAPCKW